jgi:hypothetical protein
MERFAYLAFSLSYMIRNRQHLPVSKKSIMVYIRKLSNCWCNGFGRQASELN